MHTLFISDLHLHAERTAMTDIFLAFLKNQAPQADALYILGDFFELWIGDDAPSAYADRIIDALHSLSEQIPVYFMHGNRDFLIGPDFLKRSGCTLLSDPYCLELYGESILLTHGDLLCTTDHSYQRYRRIMRHPFIQMLLLHLPLKLRKKLSGETRKISQQKQTVQYDAVKETILAWFQQYHVSTLIHGHTHRPCIEELTQEGKHYRRIVLSDWDTQGNCLRYEDDNQAYLDYFSA